MPEPTRAVPTSTLSRSAGIAAAGPALLRLRRSDDDHVRARAAAHVASRLGRLRGLPQKMGQILSMGADDPASGPLAALTEHAEPVPLELLRPALESAWGRPVGEVCASIEGHGLAASLGQVHRARLHDGREVAIKVRFPGIREAVRADLRALGWLSEPFGGLRRGFDLHDYRETIRATLADELDYRAEAVSQREYAALAKGLPVDVPEVIEELSDDGVLVTSWEEGETLDAVRAWAPDRRARLGRVVLEHTLTMLLDRGMVHADPHDGNVRFRAGPRTLLYDFGCVRRLRDEERLALLRLIRSARTAGADDTGALFAALGFDRDTLAPLRSRLPALAAALFEPFASSAKFDLTGWGLGERVGDILGEDRWVFRTAAPASLLLVMRTMHGMIRQLRLLDAPVAWKPIIDPLLDRHRRAMDTIRLPGLGPAPVGMASRLVIRVERPGKRPVRVDLPSSAIDRLEDSIDGELASRIAERSIDLRDLVRDARARGITPGPVFELEDDSGRFSVTLE